MTSELSRLVSMIEYAQQSARMKTSPVANVASHGLFTLWEKDTQHRPGVVVNPDATAEDDERWLAIQRLQQSNPPVIKSDFLKPWVEITQAPYSAPKLRQFVFGRDLIAVGTHRKVEEETGRLEDRKKQLEIDPEAMVNLDEYSHITQVRNEFLVGLEEEKVRHLMNRYLQDQVPIYRPQLSPERSLYDLFKVVFARSAVMLREHFRCVPAIIEYSKREFYNHELRPLRIPLSSERIDPPLVDVLVEDGFRDSGDINRPEAEFILQEIQNLVGDEKMQRRSIGVVSLLADKQAMYVWEKLTDSLGPELMRRHHIACGDARTFQGKERDVMFLSMVSAPNNRGAALSRDTFAQRFNVAASRARDRMYLVRSIELDQLSDKDVLRRGLIEHFSKPFWQDAETIADLRERCESPFEREVYDELTRRGFRVVPQVKVGSYRIDMVVEGANDERLAIECDGDRYHGADKWADDMQRQRILERAGWVFWRCFASAFVRRRDAVLGDLLNVLRDRGIERSSGENVPTSLHSEFRRFRANELISSKNAVAEAPSEATEKETSQFNSISATSDSLAVENATLASNDRPVGNSTDITNASGRTATAPEQTSTQPFSPAPRNTYNEESLRAFLDTNALTSEDHRGNKGALWIHLDEVGSVAARQLSAWGFNFKKGRGWWTK